ncbi:MAG TPA: radical SAM protein [Nitrospirota bacterium]|nr:radical SAM protein [Nitrospirota bacterium]
MITKARNNLSFIETHPCFSEAAHHTFGRIHLPVAPACNIQCRYCLRKFDCANESRPGITSKVLSPEEALERIRALVERNERLTVVGIAGPGDPLANPNTYRVLRQINHEFPDLTLCLSTNGLLLSERLTGILAAGVRSLTVTINAVSLNTAASIYAWISYGDKRYEGAEAAALMLGNQWKGLASAVKSKMVVKVNTVYIPGINDTDIPLIAARAGGLGAHVMNIIPLIPQADLAHLKRPDHKAIGAMRDKCRPYISQMSHCRQCRADACGILGEDKDMELEVLMARIGEDYTESVS